MSAYRTVITWLGQPIVQVAADGSASPAEGVTAQQLAEVIAWQWQKVQRLHAQQYDDLRSLFGGAARLPNPLLDDLPYRELPAGEPCKWEPTTKMPEGL